MELSQEVEGQKYEVLWVSGVPNGSVAMAWSLPIQWMARRKEVDPPNDLGAYNGPSQVMMESSTLSVVHGANGTKGGAKHRSGARFEPRS